MCQQPPADSSTQAEPDQRRKEEQESARKIDARMKQLVGDIALHGAKFGPLPFMEQRIATMGGGYYHVSAYCVEQTVEAEPIPAALMALGYMAVDANTLCAKLSALTTWTPCDAASFYVVIRDIRKALTAISDLWESQGITVGPQPVSELRRIADEIEASVKELISYPERILIRPDDLHTDFHRYATGLRAAAWNLEADDIPGTPAEAARARQQADAASARLETARANDNQPLQPLPEELIALDEWLNDARTVILARVKKCHTGHVVDAFAPLAFRLRLLIADAQRTKERQESRKAHDREYEDAQLQAIAKVIKDHQDRIRVHHCGGIAEQIASLLEHYHTKAVRSMSHVELFQQELLVNMRALALVANSIGDAETHREKNARLRGLIGMLEGAYSSISKWHIDVQSSLPPWSYTNVFQADYPIRHYLQRIDDLEGKLAAATGEPVRHAVARQEEETDPFSDRGGRW